MAIDATFWVAVSFVIFFGALIYLKMPQKVSEILDNMISCLLYTSPSPRDRQKSRMPSSA